MELVDSLPKIWRKIIVPEGISFESLHDTIQLAMGWEDCHLYDFIIPSENCQIVSDDESYYQLKIKQQMVRLKDERFMPFFNSLTEDEQQSLMTQKVSRH